MMTFLRKNVKAFLWAFALIFIGGIFLLNFTARREPSYVAKVNGKKIPYRQYLFIVNRQIQNLREEAEEEITEEQIRKIKEETLGILVEEELIYQEAKRYGLEVSEKDVVGTIYSLPQFQREGRFDPRVYHSVLANFYRSDPSSYEGQVKKGLLIRKMKRIIMDSVKVTPHEVRFEYKRRNQSIDNFEKEKEDFTQSYLQEKQYYLFRQWLFGLQRQAKIVNNLPRIEGSL